MSAEPRTLNFRQERDTPTTSFDRADPRAALIEQQGPHAWTVSLPDGEGTHSVVLVEDGDEFLGRCTCDGFEFHKGACAHLCTLRKAAVIGYPDVNGTPVRVEQVDRPDGDDLADQHDDTERVRADGGRRRGGRR